MGAKIIKNYSAKKAKTFSDVRKVYLGKKKFRKKISHPQSFIGNL